MVHSIGNAALEQIFLNARSYNGWQEKPVSEDLLRQVYDLMKFGPTSGNGCPARFVFVTSQQAKERLKPCLGEFNVEKVMAAPAAVIIAYDLEFYEKIPELFPHNPQARDWFANDAALVEETAFRNGTLQGAYLMIAARALGLDCGPLSGFDKSAVDREFFAGTSWRSNFICGLGYGDPESIFARSPRLKFEDAAQVL